MPLSDEQVAVMQEKITALEKELAACNIKIASLRMAVARQNSQHNINTPNLTEEKNKKAHEDSVWSNGGYD